MSTTPATRFVPVGSYVRRVKDGMPGRAGRISSVQRSAGWNQTTQQITWLGEWGLAEWEPGRRNSTRIEILDGPEAEAVAARFAALTCPTCAGTGLADPRRPRYDANRCPNPACVLGRLLGVEPAFDASYAAYRSWLDATQAREESYRQASEARANSAAGRLADWADAILAYDGTCVACGRRLRAGEAAQRRKAEHWEVRCAAHKAETE